ncbi:MAG: hypothetical protein V3W19_12935, partial [Desulfatiglandales bacterium]
LENHAGSLAGTVTGPTQEKTYSTILSPSRSYIKADPSGVGYLLNNISLRSENLVDQIKHLASSIKTSSVQHKNPVSEPIRQ